MRQGSCLDDDRVQYMKIVLSFRALDGTNVCSIVGKSQRGIDNLEWTEAHRSIVIELQSDRYAWSV